MFDYERDAAAARAVAVRLRFTSQNCRWLLTRPPDASWAHLLIIVAYAPPSPAARAAAAIAYGLHSPAK